jgi:hypothetical protein
LQSYFIEIAQAPAESSWVVFAKWAIQILSGAFLLLSFLITYRHNVKVRASDLLLKLEELSLTSDRNSRFWNINRHATNPSKDY